MKKLIPSLIALYLLSACEEVFQKTIEYEIPEEASRITIDSKITAGDSVYALVGTTVYALGSEDPELDFGATVKLYEDGNYIEHLSPSQQTGYYFGSYRSRAGHRYSLEASRPGYQPAIGSCTLLEPVSINSAVAEPSQNAYRINFSFSDPPAPGDYYYFSVALVPPNGPDEIVYFSTLDPTVEIFDAFSDPFNEEGSMGQRGYLSDQYFNGKEKKLMLKLDIYFEQPQPDEIEAAITLYHISEDYYLYARSVGAAGNSDGLFGEPVQIYSNVMNGYGIVGAATPFRQQFPLTN